MRIIAVNRFYRPDHSATAQLLGDLAEHLAGEGHEVSVITSRLRYEGGEMLAASETIKGVRVRRVWTTRFGRGGLIGRAIDYLTFYISAFVAMLGESRRGAVLIAKTDPPLISVPAGLACRLRGMRLVNWCQDLFPEIAAALGIRWARGWAGSLLRGLRNRSLRQAHLNVVLNEAMAQRLRAEGVSPDRIRIIANWADASLCPVPRETNALRAEWGYGLQTFVMGYSGNLGRAHMPSAIAALVRASAGIENLAWLFIGGGAGLESLKVQLTGLPNVAFRPYQPLSRLSESLSVPDAHLISLDPGCEGLIMPSKLYGVLAVGRPVLALASPAGGLTGEVVRHEAGIAIDPAADADQWAASITRLVREQGHRVTTMARVPAIAQARLALSAWCDGLKGIVAMPASCETQAVIA